MLMSTPAASLKHPVHRRVAVAAWASAGPAAVAGQAAAGAQSAAVGVARQRRPGTRGRRRARRLCRLVRSCWQARIVGGLFLGGEGGQR